MRGRKWVLVLASLGAITLLSVYVAWRATRASDIIKNMLLEQVKPFLAQDTDIDQVEMTLSGLSLKGVYLAPKDQSFSLQIEEVQFGFKLRNLIRYRLSPHRMAHEIVLVNPRLIVQRVPDMIQNGNRVETAHDYRRWAEELGTLRRAAVVRGQILLEETPGDTVMLAHDLYGWLQAGSTDSAALSLAGKLFDSDETSLILKGKVNLLQGLPLKAEVEIKESSLPARLPIILPDYIQGVSGSIRGRLQYLRGQGLHGSVIVEDGAFHIKNANLFMEAVNVEGGFDHSDIVLDGTIGRFNGSLLRVSGRINRILEPEVDISITCGRFDVPAFFARLVPDTRLSLGGAAGFDLRFTGPLDNATMEGRFSSSSLTAYGIPFDDFTAAVGIADSVLVLEGAGAQSENLDFDLEGRLDFSRPNPPTSLKLNIRGDFQPSLPNWARERIRLSSGEMSIEVDGPIRELGGRVNGSLAVASVEGDTLRLTTDFDYTDHVLAVDVSSNRLLSVTGRIGEPFRKNTDWDIRMEGLNDLLLPLTAGALRRRLDGLNVRALLTGSNEAWSASMEGVDLDRGDLPPTFEFTLETDRTAESRHRFDVSFGYRGASDSVLPLRARGNWTAEEIVCERGLLGDFLLFEGRYPYDAGGLAVLNARFSGFELEKLHDVFPDIRAYGGEVRGDMMLSGTREAPNAEFEVTIHDGSFHERGSFDGGVEATWRAGRFHLGSLTLKKDGQFLFGGGAQRVLEDSLVGGLGIRDVDLGDLLYAFTGEDALEGTGTAEFRLGGRLHQPLIFGNLALADGAFESFRFDTLEVELVDTLMNGAGFASGTFSIRRGRLERDDGVRMVFFGEIPHGHADADLSLLAQGNVLGLLPEVSPTFKAAAGSGEIRTRWGGRRGEWVLGSAGIRVEHGFVDLGDFAGPFSDVDIEADLEVDDRFLRIHHASGTANKERFVVSNRWEPEDEGLYTPFAIDPLNIHLGVLLLQTQGKGLFAHLPGLMERREQGWIDFMGEKESDPFVIGGPPETPLLKGTLELSDFRLTYPFLVVEKDSATIRLIEFLERIHWDIRVVPVKNVHYVREIRAIFGGVFADLKLKNRTGDFQVRGSINEETFRVGGNLEATEGTIELLEHVFRPERITFDYPFGVRHPIIAGRAYTTVIDSLGMPATIWLSISAMDEFTGTEGGQVRWDQVQFRFSTDNPNLARAEADLLAALGYSSGALGDRAYDALGMRVENFLFRPIFRPIERGIRKTLGLDVVRLSSMFTRNLVQIQTVEGYTYDPRYLFRRARWTLGKSIWPGFFLTYTGQIQDAVGMRYDQPTLGFRHALSLEYTIRPDLFLEMEYRYDSHLLEDRRRDRRIWLRHVFPF